MKFNGEIVAFMLLEIVAFMLLVSILVALGMFVGYTLRWWGLPAAGGWAGAVLATLIHVRSRQ